MTSAAVLDRRITPARADLAAAFLSGQVKADRFVAGAQRMVTAPVAPLRRAPRADAPLDSETLRGETVTVFDEAEGWAWVQLGQDRYVGYMPASALGAGEAPDVRVNVLRTFIYPGPGVKLPVVAALPFGAACRVEGQQGSFVKIAEGFVWSGHLRPLDAPDADFVEVAERFLGVPYLWGGRSSFGLDCSGLVQTALAAAGIAAPRDSDMQASGLGTALDPAASLGRGDLVFWPGHVGMMRNSEELLHANGQVMQVASEPLAEAIDRIRSTTRTGEHCVRRLPGYRSVPA